MVRTTSGRTKIVKAASFKAESGGAGLKRQKKAMMVPAVNVDENENEYLLTIAAPGFDKQAIVVKVENDIIKISAAREISNENCIHDRCEYDYRRWERAFWLPDDADSLLTRARYYKGELIIVIPKGRKENTLFTLPVYVY
jgi:HSP20 family protein